MTSETPTCLPTTAWFLFDEDGQALGQVYKKALPQAGVPIDGGPRFEAAVVVEFTELQATCAMRRFRVVVRILS
jgi:hypothetical protein